MSTYRCKSIVFTLHSMVFILWEFSISVYVSLKRMHCITSHHILTPCDTVSSSSFLAPTAVDEGYALPPNILSHIDPPTKNANFDLFPLVVRQPVRMFTYQQEVDNQLSNTHTLPPESPFHKGEEDLLWRVELKRPCKFGPLNLLLDDECGLLIVQLARLILVKSHH